MRRNFEFDGFSVIMWGDRFIDLHNAYDLRAFGTDLAGSAVELRFTRNEYAIAPDTLPSEVTLACTGNVRLAFNDLTAIAASLEHEGIEIAYFNGACDWLSFLDEEMALSQKPEGLHIRFINGLAVRIFCDEATLTTNFPGNAR